MGRAHNEAAYKRFVAGLKDSPQSCWICGRYGATTGDHVPPLVLHDHVAGSGCCEIRAACHHCNTSTGASLGNSLRNHGRNVSPHGQRKSAPPSGAW